jgi:two-component system, LytTR family, response regulator
MLPEITCIIIDDEPKAVSLLKERLNILYPNIKVAGEFYDWKKGLEVLRTSKVDLLFIDISMPEKTGIDFLKLFPTMPFEVIFVTAYSEYALQAIKLSAMGYVLKPVDDLELSFAVNKVIDKINKVAVQKNNGVAQSVTPKIGIPNVKGIDYLNADDILYFESVNKYTKVVTKDYSIMSSYNLGEFKKIVDADSFYQVHRSYIVNLYKIKRYESAGMLIMDDNMQIPVSKNIRNEFLAVFSKISRTAGMKHKEEE